MESHSPPLVRNHPLLSPSPPLQSLKATPTTSVFQSPPPGSVSASPSPTPFLPHFFYNSKHNESAAPGAVPPLQDKLPASQASQLFSPGPIRPQHARKKDDSEFSSPEKRSMPVEGSDPLLHGKLLFKDPGAAQGGVI